MSLEGTFEANQGFECRRCEPVAYLVAGSSCNGGLYNSEEGTCVPIAPWARRSGPRRTICAPLHTILGPLSPSYNITVPT